MKHVDLEVLVKLIHSLDKAGIISDNGLRLVVKRDDNSDMGLVQVYDGSVVSFCGFDDDIELFLYDVLNK